jgi:hypothetical protein
MRHIVPKQAYIRMLLLMIAVSLSVASLLAVLLSQRFSDYAIAEISKVNQRELSHTAADIDSLVERLKAYAITLYEDQDISAWISSAKEDPIAFVSATQRLTRIINAESFIGNVYLINMQKRQIYDMKAGLRSLGMFDEQEGLLDVFQENREFLRFFYFGAGAGEDASPCFAMKIPATPAKNYFSGYIVLTLNLAQFQERFMPGDADGGTLTLLSDAMNQSTSQA